MKAVSCRSGAPQPDSDWRDETYIRNWGPRLWRRRHNCSRQPSAVGAVERGKALDLLAVRGEIPGRQPALECRLARRPFAIDDREPGGVAVPAVADHVLAEDALEHEAAAQRRAPRRRVERIAFPLVTPVAKLLDGVTGEEVLRLGAERRALQRRCIDDGADLDHPHRRADAHQGRRADDALVVVDNRVGVRILGGDALGEPGAERRLIGERAGRGDVGPDRVGVPDLLPQRISMVLRQSLDTAVAALQRHGAGPGRRRGIDRRPDRLSGLRMFVIGHDCRFFRSSWKNALSSAFGITPAKLSNLPGSAMSRADLMKACMATRANVPPTLMRRTPMAARSPTVKPKAPLLRKLTGFGATALTTASICSRVLMPGA